MQDIDLFNNHSLWKTLQAIEDEGKYKDLEPAAKHYLSALLQELAKNRDGVNPYYVPSASLDSLNNYLSFIRSNIPANPSQVIRYTDEAFAELSSRWPAHYGRYVADIAKETFDSITGEMAEGLEKAQASVDRVEELEASYNAKAEEVEQSLLALKGDAEESIKNAEEDTRARFAELDEAYKKQAEDTKSETAESIQAIKDGFIARLTEKEEAATKILKEVQNTSNAASGKVVADSYGEYAVQKERQTKGYDLAAIWFAVIGVVLVGCALVLLHADETSATVFRMTASVASFVISGYLFRRGTFCQREAKAAKRTELTLKQYRAFIANLDEEEQRRITTEVADRIFIRGEIDDDAPTITEALAQRGLNEKQLKTLLEIIKITDSAQ